jgi:hypothetical protein
LHAPAAERRESGTRVFMSQDTADALRRDGIRVITWRAFRQMRADKNRKTLVEDAGPATA